MTEEMRKIVEDFEKRVVKITADEANKDPIGSGIIFRVENKLFVQTCYHVIRNRTAVYIEHEDFKEVIVTRDGFSCALQDKAFYEITPRNRPELYCKEDYLKCLVHVKVGRKPRTGLIEYHYEKQSYVLHINADSEIRNRGEIKVKFSTEAKWQDYSTSDLCYCSHTRCCLLFLQQDHVPRATKDMFTLLQFWEENLRDPQIVTISFPGGRARSTTVGHVQTKKGRGQFGKCESVHFKIDSVGKTISNHRDRLIRCGLPLDISVATDGTHFLQGDEKRKILVHIENNKIKCVEECNETQTKVLSLEVGNNDDGQLMKFRNTEIKCFYKMDKHQNHITPFLAEMTGKSVYKGHKVVEMSAHIFHDAPTEPGSSGGAVLIIGTYNGEYKTLLAMHCGKVGNNSTGIGCFNCFQN